MMKKLLLIALIGLLSAGLFNTVAQDDTTAVATSMEEPMDSITSMDADTLSEEPVDAEEMAAPEESKSNDVTTAVIAGLVIIVIGAIVLSRKKKK